MRLSENEEIMLFLGTVNAQKVRNALDKAERIINEFLEHQEGTKKYLYITNPDGTRFKIEYGARIENCSITSCVKK